MGNILNALDIYVQPSLSEGLPVALLEAMSAGVPVIATDVGGVAEIVGKDTYGLLVRPGSSEELFSALVRIAENTGAFKTVSVASKKMVQERFSLDAMARHYAELYKKILGNS